MTFEQPRASSPETAEAVSADIIKAHERIKTLEQQLQYGDAALASENLTPGQAAVQNKIVTGLLFEISGEKAKLTVLEKQFEEMTHGKISGLEKAGAQTSYELFEKQYQSLPKAQLETKRAELQGQLATLIEETRGNEPLQLLSTDFSSKAEKENKIAELKQQITILDKLIVRAEKYDVNSDPWAEVSKRRGAM